MSAGQFRLGGRFWIELVLGGIALGFFGLIAHRAVEKSSLEANLAIVSNDAIELYDAFVEFHEANGHYPVTSDQQAFDRTSLDPLRRRGYYEGTVGSRIGDGKVDAYVSTDRQGRNQEFWLEMSLAADPTIRLLVARSDDAPLGGGTWREGAFVYRDGDEAPSPMSDLLRTPTTIPPQRLRALQPFVEKLQTWNQRIPGSGSGRAAAVLIGRQRLVVESWERRIIVEASAAAVGDAHRLTVEGLACMAKTLTDLIQLGRKDDDDSRDALYRRQAELLLDTAIGTALLREVQQAIHGSVTAGDLEEARQLTSLQNRMRRVLSQSMERLTESNLPRVEPLADSFTEVAGEAGTEAAEAEEPELQIEIQDFEEEPAETPPARRAAPRDFSGEDGVVSTPRIEMPAASRPAAAPTSAARTTILAILAAVAFLTWGLFVALPGVARNEPVQIGTADLPHPGEYVEVLARFPSLFVDVDATAWDRLSEPERWARVRELSEIVSPLHYDGLLVRDASGEPLGQWVRGRGVLLYGGTVIEERD